MNSLAPPSIAELLDKDPSRADFDALWFSAATLAAMRRDLSDRSSRALKAGDLSTYGKSVRALAAATFALRLADQGRARAEGVKS
jgi:hypothetical protein